MRIRFRIRVKVRVKKRIRVRVRVMVKIKDKHCLNPRQMSHSILLTKAKVHIYFVGNIETT